jgi:hypothetical protein
MYRQAVGAVLSVQFSPVRSTQRVIVFVHSVAVLTLCAEDHHKKTLERRLKGSEGAQDNSSVDVPVDQLTAGRKYEVRWR